MVRLSLTSTIKQWRLVQACDPRFAFRPRVLLGPPGLENGSCAADLNSREGEIQQHPQIVSYSLRVFVLAFLLAKR